MLHVATCSLPTLTEMSSNSRSARVLKISAPKTPWPSCADLRTRPTSCSGKGASQKRLRKPPRRKLNATLRARQLNSFPMNGCLNTSRRPRSIGGKKKKRWLRKKQKKKKNQKKTRRKK